MGRIVGTVLLIVVVVFGLAWAFGLVNLNQTREAKLPSVSVEGGQMPKFNADVAKVDVGTKNETVDVPTVGTTRKNVEVPTVEVQKPAQ
jgi:hypothetical protein